MSLLIIVAAGLYIAWRQMRKWPVPDGARR